MYVCMYVLTFGAIHSRRGDYCSSLSQVSNHAGKKRTKAKRGGASQRSRPHGAARSAELLTKVDTPITFAGAAVSLNIHTQFTYILRFVQMLPK